MHSGSLDFELSDNLANALRETKNIEASKLYSHQALAINALHPSPDHPLGQNVIISTSTSSGKSLIYQLPVVEALEQNPETTALYVFPTKALAQDQKRSLGELVAAVEGLEDVKVATFDGDTPREDRDYIRENANVVRPGALVLLRYTFGDALTTVTANGSSIRSLPIRTCFISPSCRKKTGGGASSVNCASSSSTSCTSTPACLVVTWLL